MSTQKKFSRAVIVIVALFFILKFMLPYRMDDDANLYWYMGKLVGEGEMPYRDFRTVHPPLMFFLSGTLFRVFGASLSTGRLVPALSGVAILLLTYLIAERSKKGLGNLAAAILFLSPHFQTSTSSMLGAALNLAFLLGSFYLITGKEGRRNDILAGILFILAALSRFTPFPLFLLVLGYAAMRKRKNFLYGLLIASPLAIAAAMVPNFIQYTFLDAFSRVVLSSPRAAGLVDFLFVQRWAAGLGAIGAYLFMDSGKKNEGLLLSVVGAASIFLMLLLNETRHWYVLYSLPFFAILASYAAQKIKAQIPKYGIAVPILIGVVLFWGFAPVLTYDDAHIAEEILAPMVTPGMGVYDLSGTRGAYMGVKYGTRIPKELIDNNAIALASGKVQPEYVVSVLQKSPPKYLIDYRSDERTTYWMNTEIAGFVEENYAPLGEAVEENTGNSLVIWERR